LAVPPYRSREKKFGKDQTLLFTEKNRDSFDCPKKKKCIDRTRREIVGMGTRFPLLPKKKRKREKSQVSLESAQPLSDNKEIKNGKGRNHGMTTSRGADSKYLNERTD